MHSAVRQPMEARLSPEVVARHLSGLLSDRELEVAQMAAAGLPTAEIARRLFVTVNTVKTHVRHILRKTGATSRADLIRWLVAFESDPQHACAAQQGDAQEAVRQSDPQHACTVHQGEPQGAGALHQYGHKQATPQGEEQHTVHQGTPPLASAVQQGPCIPLRDPLTGLHVRAAYGPRAADLLRTPPGQGLSVVLLELEGRAHLTPVDRAVVDLAVADALTTAIRSADLVFRWADHQFLALLPSTDREGARAVTMRLALCLGQWASANGYDLLFFLASSSSQEGIASPDELVEAAERRIGLALKDIA